MEDRAISIASTGTRKGTTNTGGRGGGVRGMLQGRERKKNEESLSAFRRAIYADRRQRGLPAMVRIIHSPSNHRIE